eukprot:scaffold156109_cov35-Tisochrysis_lutea.AAC.2
MPVLQGELATTATPARHRLACRRPRRGDRPQRGRHLGPPGPRRARSFLPRGLYCWAVAAARARPPAALGRGRPRAGTRAQRKRAQRVSPYNASGIWRCSHGARSS